MSKGWKIAVLGLGIIGSRAWTLLNATGLGPVAAWNRTPKGIPGENSDLDAVCSDANLILLYLKDAGAVRSVVTRLFSLPPGERILVNHSTVDLETTRWLGRECSDRGMGFVDCPFTGSRDAAAGGALVYYAGGPSDLIDRIEPVLLLTAKAVLRSGPVGSATVLKLVTNLISACTVQALAESLATATRHGISPGQLIDAVARNACGSPLAAMKLPAMARAEFETHFSLSNMLKDSLYALELAAEAGLETPALSAVSRRMAELCESGLADQDYSSLAAPYRIS